MNDASKCARWQSQPHDCEILDSLLNLAHFSPPVSPGGHAVLSVVTFHRDYPAGRTFTRAGLGGHWTRVT